MDVKNRCEREEGLGYGGGKSWEVIVLDREDGCWYVKLKEMKAVKIYLGTCVNVS